MLYGETYVDNEKLKEWINTWTIGEHEKQIVYRKFNSYDNKVLTLLDTQISAIKEFVNLLPTDGDWRSMQSMCSRLLYDIFFKVNDNAIKIANFYECLIEPCDVLTEKRIVSGYDYKNIGRINILENGDLIGSISEKSDIFWSVFLGDFVKEDDYGSMTHMIDHEKYFTLQFWNEYNSTEEGIQQYIDEILLNCSIKYNLNFRTVNVPDEIKLLGTDSTYDMEFRINNYEKIPLKYFNNGFQTVDYRLSFLSYYQVLEYFYIRAQNNHFIYNLRESGTTDISQIPHSNLRKALKKYNNTTKEKESLKLVLSQSLNINAFKNWLTGNQSREKKYTTEILSQTSVAINLTKADNKIISKLAERIYYFRCAIAHAKGDSEEYLIIPNIGNEIIENELELMKHLAFLVLNFYK